MKRQSKESKKNNFLHSFVNEIIASFKLLSLKDEPVEEPSLMSELPNELIAHILHFISPLKAHLDVRKVCPRWTPLLNNNMNDEMGINEQTKVELWDTQEEEIKYLLNNKRNALKRVNDARRVQHHYERLETCPTERSTIALYARELRLNAVNRAMIIPRIVESQLEWRQYQQTKIPIGKKLDCRVCYLTRFPQSLIESSYDSEVLEYIGVSVCES